MDRSASVDLSALRDGSLVEIIGREYDGKDGSLWYELRSAPVNGGEVLEGWVPGVELDIYAAREQAERALAGRAAAAAGGGSD